MMRCSFSEGGDAWKETESKEMPRNLMDVLGPDVFSSERGTPISEKVFVRVSSPRRGGDSPFIYFLCITFMPVYS